SSTTRTDCGAVNGIALSGCQSGLLSRAQWGQFEAARIVWQRLVRHIVQRPDAVVEDVLRRIARTVDVAVAARDRAEEDRPTLYAELESRAGQAEAQVLAAVDRRPDVLVGRLRGAVDDRALSGVRLRGRDRDLAVYAAGHAAARVQIDYAATLANRERAVRSRLPPGRRRRDG